jgi:hypothetical protein
VTCFPQQLLQLRLRLLPSPFQVLDGGLELVDDSLPLVSIEGTQPWKVTLERGPDLVPPFSKFIQRNHDLNRTKFPQMYEAL